MKILVIRISSLGDVILTTFTLRLIWQKFPNAHIGFLVSTEYAPALHFNPYIQNIIEYDKNLPFSKHIRNTLSIYSQSHYDVILDLQNNLRSRIYTIGKAKKIHRFDKRRLYKLSLVYLNKRQPYFEYIPILYKNSFPELINFDDGLGLELWTTNDKNGVYKPFYRQPKLRNVARVAIAPGAKHFTKRLPQKLVIQTIEQFLEKFNTEIFLIGGKSDASYCSEMVIDSTRVFNICGEFDVTGTAAFLDECDVVVSADSAVVHIASARQIPIVVVYGSTVPEFGFAPFRVPHEIVEMNDVSCRPCSHIGRSKCPLQHFNCMEKITSQKILEAVNNLITKPKSA